jgi:hypothetical protein
MYGFDGLRFLSEMVWWVGGCCQVLSALVGHTPKSGLLAQKLLLWQLDARSSHTMFANHIWQADSDPPGTYKSQKPTFTAIGGDF